MIPPQPDSRDPKYEEIFHFAEEALGLSCPDSASLSPFKGRGSDRAFFRLKWNRESVVLIHYDPKRVENSYYADIAAFLRSIDVPAPRLIRHDPLRCFVLMEDLGDTDLWSLRETPWETRRTLYQKALTIVQRLHAFPKKEFPSDRVRLMEDFGPDLYRWERDYFRDHFVREVCGIEPDSSFHRELEVELSGLAGRLAAVALPSGQCLVHRDLQSQNVMIRDGEPFLIDFQGMRFGNPFYDLGSLLGDPYVTFSSAELDELLSFDYKLSGWADWTAFQDCFWEASAQRLMQALGAYGFLSLSKGLAGYLDYVPAGLRNLHQAASKAATLPRLRELASKCQKKLSASQYHLLTGN